ncbi:hypothetical protein ACFL3V_02980 [Nanoarchaeota archaeon]
MIYRPGTREIDTTYWQIFNTLDKIYRTGKVNGTTKEQFYDNRRIEDVVGETFMDLFAKEPEPVLRAAADSGLWVDVCWWGERNGAHYQPKVKYMSEWIDMPKELIPDFDRQGKYRTHEQVTPCKLCENHYQQQIAVARAKYGNSRHDDPIEQMDAA